MNLLPSTLTLSLSLSRRVQKKKTQKELEKKIHFFCLPDVQSIQIEYR